MGLAYELKMLPFPPRVLAKDYLAINPLGTIPFMIDGETRMTESSAICHYLGTRYGPTPLVVGADEPAYGAYLNWLYFGEATLTFPQTLVLRYSFLEPEERRNPQVAADYTKWFFGRLRAVEAATGKAETLTAGRFTAAESRSATPCGSPKASASPRIRAQRRGLLAAPAAAGRLPARDRPRNRQRTAESPGAIPEVIDASMGTGRREEA